MIWIRTELGDIGLLLSDENDKIRSLAKLFFQEMNKKDNKILYNILPEVIYKMSKENKQEEF